MKLILPSFREGGTEIALGLLIEVNVGIEEASVQFSRSVMSDTLQLHKSQHSRPPCPSPTLGVYSDSCPSSR